MDREDTKSALSRYRTTCSCSPRLHGRDDQDVAILGLLAGLVPGCLDLWHNRGQMAQRGPRGCHADWEGRAMSPCEVFSTFGVKKKKESAG
jgi:hypothetical protein